MSEIKHTTKFSPSPDICSNCTRLLLSKLRDAVLLHESFVSLYRSAQSCSLCYLIWSGLVGLSYVKDGPRSVCDHHHDLTTTKPGQPSEVWGRRHMVDFASLGMDLMDTTEYGWDIPISFIEAMVVKTDLVGHLARKLRLPSVPESTKLMNAWWGLKCDPDVVREAGACPYFWEYSQEVRTTWRRIKGGNFRQAKGDGPCILNPSGSATPRDVWWGKGVHGPYHRAVIEVAPLDNSPSWNGHASRSRPRSKTSDQRDCGVSGIVQRLKLEEAPILCGSPARLELAQRWWEDCLKWHENCQYWSESMSLPSRLIDVGPRDGSQEPFLFTTGPSDTGLYACLSHRWGGAKVLQTVKGDPPGTPNGRSGTFSKFQSAIPLESMPKTFQDAIEVTRRFGFQYIWIDSLCIVQDRPSDWEAEAQKMGSYYYNATLTIVAGSAVSADSGLFFPIKFERPKVPCHVGSISLELPDCRHHGAEPHTFPLFAREPNTDRSDSSYGVRPTCGLDERAWVLQEQVLSPRALIFTDEGVYWECTDLSASESHPHGTEYHHARSTASADPNSNGEVFLPTYQTLAQHFKYMFVDHRRLSEPSPTPSLCFIADMIPTAHNELHREIAALCQAGGREPRLLSAKVSKEMMIAMGRQTQSEKHQESPKVDEEGDNLTACTPRPSSPQPRSLPENLPFHSWMWHQLVKDYSQRQLTRESDRLIAIQGLVSMVNELRKDRYYAGLWGHTLREDMLWQVQDLRISVQHYCDCMPRKMGYFTEVKPRRRLEESEARRGVAPSWSWASADQGVIFVTPHGGVGGTLEYFFRPRRIALDDDTSVFNVQGRLTLEGVLRPIGVTECHDELPHEQFVGSMYDPSDPSKKAIGTWSPDRIPSTSGVVVCVPVIMMRLALPNGGWDRHKVVIYCLVLEPTENCRLRNKASKLLEFRRVGLATFHTKHREFLGLGNSQRTNDDRPWDVRVKEWTRKPVVIDIV